MRDRVDILLAKFPCLTAHGQWYAERRHRSQRGHKRGKRLHVQLKNDALGAVVAQLSHELQVIRDTCVCGAVLTRDNNQNQALTMS